MIAGTLTLEMNANLARLADDMAKAKAIVGDGVGVMSNAVGSLKRTIEGLGVGLSLAGLTALVKNAAESADAAAKMSDRFGIATDTLIGMQHAADLAGVSNEGLTNALRGIAKSSVEAMQGSEQARMAYQRLGINVAEFLKLPMNEQLSTVIDRLGTMENATVRNATAQALMGRQAGQMMGLVAEGSKAFKEAEEDTKAWGLALDRVDAAKIELANDAIKRAEAATKGFFTQVALNLAPMLQALANGFADASKEAQGYRQEIVEGTGYTIEAIGYLLNILQGVRYAYMAIKVVLGDLTGATLQAFAQMSEVISNSTVMKWAAQLPGFMGEAARAVQESSASMAEDLNSLSQGFFDTSDQVQKELNDLVAAGLPHDRFVAEFERLKGVMSQAAKEIAAKRAEMNKPGGDIGITPFDQYNAALARQLEALITHNQTALQVVEDRYQKEQALLDEAQQKQFITDDYWQGQSALLYANYQQARQQAIFQEFQAQQAKNQGIVQMEQNTWRLGAEFLQVFAGKSRAAAIAVIAINKALSIAQVINATAVASMRAIADLGPELGIPLAAEIKAMGAVQIGLIAATGIAQVSQVGAGGASGGSPSNPVSTTPGLGAPFTQPTASSQTVVNVNVTGVVTNDVVDQLVDSLRNAIDNHDVVIIGPNSRQAADLAA